MAESPAMYEVHVKAADLKGETPVAVRDGLDRYELAIDFSWPPDAIAAGLQAIFQEAVETERWSRNDTREHSAATEEACEAAPHTENGLDC